MSTANSRSCPAPSRVLIVDDDPVIRIIAREQLGAAGFDVLEAADGQEGVVVFERERPDLVLLDVEMPGMDGFDVCAAIRATDAGRFAPILILTGRDDVDSIKSAYEVGATDFVSKPLNWVVLEHRIRYILRASESFLTVRTQQTRMDEVQRYARLGSWEIDLETGQIWVSNTLRKMLDFGDESDHFEAKKLARLVHPDDLAPFRSVFAEAVRDKTGFSLEHRTLDADGSERIMHTQARYREGEGGSETSAIDGFSQDITERRRTEAQVEFLSYSDHLTGLPNRSGLNRQLEGAFLRAQRSGTAAVVLAVGLDQFKRVNDTFGHSAGDSLLKYVADRLTRCIREVDEIAGRADSDSEASLSRFGGDEFIILLEGVSDPADAGRVARRVLGALERPILVEGHEVRITASIGIAAWPGDGGDAESLLRNADSAMYHAKELGRANFQFYREELNADAFVRLELETALRRAIENEELIVHYQPKLHLESGGIIGCEALVRWPNAPDCVGSPEDFIPIAEGCGMITALGDQVLRQACASARGWQERGHADFRLAVNLSPGQLNDVKLIDRIDRILEETGFEPHLLELEITESALIRNEEPALRALDKLRRRGIRISLDDFGTGFSSLSYLKRFPVQSIKIDKSFVFGIGSDDEDEAITAAILSMAKDLALDVVAEGVETQSQLRFLRDRHCDAAQGFLISPPLSAEEFESFLEQRSV